MEKIYIFPMCTLKGSGTFRHGRGEGYADAWRRDSLRTEGSRFAGVIYVRRWKKAYANTVSFANIFQCEYQKGCFVFQ